MIERTSRTARVRMRAKPGERSATTFACLLTFVALASACSLPQSEFESEEDAAGDEPGSIAEDEDGGSEGAEGGRSRPDTGIKVSIGDPLDASTEVDASGDASLDASGDTGVAAICPGGQTRDCLGVCGGTALVDDCNVCDGKNASKDCAGMCGGSARADCSGVCNGPNPPRAYYRDLDVDNLGDPRSSLEQCTLPAGYVTNRDDCDDTRRGVCTPTDALRFKRKITATPSLPWNQGALAGLGDVDGDAVPDLAVAQRIVFMNANGTVKSVRAITFGDLGLAAAVDLRASFGTAVAALGDVNGDGIPDLAISEPPALVSYASVPTDPGRLWILLLARSGAPLATGRLQVPLPSYTSTSCSFAAMGWGGSLAAFDLDRDGRMELAAGTTPDCAASPSGARITGRIELLRIGTTGATTRIAGIGQGSLTAQPPPYGEDEYFGATLGAAGDANSDDAGDLAILTSSNKLWTLMLSRAGALVGSARISAVDTGNTLLGGMTRVFGPLPSLGASTPLRVLANLPVLTTRGGLLAARPPSAQGAQTYRMFYPRELNVESLLAVGDGFGQAGASLGDLERDGLPELLVTAPGDDVGGANTGAAYLLGFVADCSNQSLRGDCNATAADGCESPLTTTDNCGACGQSCTGALNSTAGTCSSAGRCVLTCAANFGDCNDDVRDGCETDLRTNLNHCGACGTKCNIVNHAMPVCTNRVCGVSPTECEPMWSNLNGTAGDGCEACGLAGQQDFTPEPSADFYPAPAPCGRDQMCQAQTWRPTSGSLTVVTYGRCVTVCPLGRGDCNGVAGDGCEANLSLQSQCGACGPNTGCGVWSYLDYCVLNDTGTNYTCR